MKSSFVLFILLLMFSTVQAQTSLDDLKHEEFFDFWVGTWNLEWDDQTAQGGVAKGVNEITKILDGQVIQENFQANTGSNKGYKGRSFTVYDPKAKNWKQTWVDSRGGYLDFEGVFQDNKRIFIRKGIAPWGEEIMQRMVFHDIEKDSFTWDWEISTDNGSNWELKWRINYTRIE